VTVPDTATLEGADSSAKQALVIQKKLKANSVVNKQGDLFIVFPDK
jgi:hypothetical protein